MSRIQQIEDALRRLSEPKQAAFRAWYAEFDADQRDRQLAADARDAKLDWLVDEARRGHRAGRCTDR